ncbi:MAG: serine/threonine protein kinase [Deltaproteobacteria bacterium]|nr:serine/threonine protein kinase [Deltaproteobacteria bacterium]
MAGKTGKGAETPPSVPDAAANGVADTVASMDSDLSGARPADGHADTMATPLSGNSEPGSSDLADALIGQTLSGEYQVTCRIGKGGMGAVYEAKHTKIGKRVAVKVLLDKYQEREQVVARLEQEARLAASIGHEHIIDITTIGTTIEGRTFVVMEYLEGESLGERLAKSGRVDPDRAIRIGRQIASALGAAHEKGIVHRDVKPDNVFLLQRKGQDFVKVVDFGISKAMSDDDDGNSPRLTQTGMVLGTPLYMSPEQAQGAENLDRRIDIYALGVILYEMVTGEVPFTGSNYLSVISRVIADDPVPPNQRDAKISPELEAVILKAMAKERDDRYQTMEELEGDLEKIQLGDPRLTTSSLSATAARSRPGKSKMRTLWAVAGVAVVAAGVVFTVSLLLGDDEPVEQKPVAAVAPPPPDAAPAPPPPDAAIPATRIAVVNIASVPPGAKVYSQGGSRFEGTTPFDFKCDKDEKRIELIAELDGHDDAKIDVQPAIDDGGSATISLKKVKSGNKRKRLRTKSPTKTGKSGKKPVLDETAGGDLEENPYNKPAQ